MLVGRPRPFREGPVARPGAAGPPPPMSRRPRSAHPRPGRHRLRVAPEPTSRRTRSARSTPYLPDAASSRALPRRGPRDRQPCRQPALRPLRPPRPGPRRTRPAAGIWSRPAGRPSTARRLVTAPGDSCERIGRRSGNGHRDRLMGSPLGMIWNAATVSPRRGGGGLAGRRRGSRSGIRPRCRPGRSSTCGGRCGRSPGGRRVRRCR